MSSTCWLNIETCHFLICTWRSLNKLVIKMVLIFGKFSSINWSTVSEKIWCFYCSEVFYKFYLSYALQVFLVVFVGINLLPMFVVRLFTELMKRFSLCHKVLRALLALPLFSFRGELTSCRNIHDSNTLLKHASHCRQVPVLHESNHRVGWYLNHAHNSHHEWTILVNTFCDLWHCDALVSP